MIPAKLNIFLRLLLSFLPSKAVTVPQVSFDVCVVWLCNTSPIFIIVELLTAKEASNSLRMSVTAFVTHAHYARG